MPAFQKIPQDSAKELNSQPQEIPAKTRILHTAEEATCCSRPAPEGSGSVSSCDNDPAERSQGRGNPLEGCQFVTKPTMTQMLDLTDPESEGPTSEPEQDWGVAFGNRSADLAGRVQMVQGGSLPASPTLGTSAAFSFFTRAAQKLSLSSRLKRPRPQHRSAPPTDFSSALRRAPPPIPPCLLRARSKVKENPGMGKVKVMVRVCPSIVTRDGPKSASFLKADPRKKQLTLADPSHRGPDHGRSSTPKTFSFDAVFTQDASQAEVCAGSVAEVVQSVINGADGCIFCFGHIGLGKTYTMMGSDGSAHSLGVVPCAISWLYRLLEERRERTGACFSLTVSAVEISGRDETLCDLLRGLSGDSPRNGRSSAPYLQEDPICGCQLRNQAELEALSPEQAASLLDEALSARSSCRESREEEHRHSHLLFTLHLYQEHSQTTLSRGRSRLHFIDLGSCEPITGEGYFRGGGQRMTLPALGTVILALTSGAKHVPYRDSKLTMLLRAALGNINCRTTMIAHVSDSATDYAETLSTVQLASRLHRSRKKKSKCSSNSSGADTLWEDSQTSLKFNHPQILSLSLPTLRFGDRSCCSAGVQPRDTVVYVGLGGSKVCEREVCIAEAPPTAVPIIPSLNRRQLREGGHLSEGDHIKCNTFAELQEWLEGVGDTDGCRGGPLTLGTGSTVAKPIERPQFPTKTPILSCQVNNLPERCAPTSRLADSASTESVNGRYKWRDPTPDRLRGRAADREKAFCSGGLSQSGSLNRRLQSKPVPPASELGVSQRLKLSMEDIYPCRAPPVGMSHKPEPEKSPTPGTHTPSGAQAETRSMHSTPRGKSFDRGALTTTVTLRRPVELNGEDELVYTLVEELSIGGLVESAMPSGMNRFHRDHRSSQTLPAGFQRVAIVSSINDEFDAYTSQVGSTGSRAWKAKTQGTGPESALRSNFHENPSKDFSIKREIKGLPSGGTTVALDKSTLSKYSTLVESTKAPSRDYSTRVNAVSPSPRPQLLQAHSTLPRTAKTTSSTAESNFIYEQQNLKEKLVDPWLHFERLLHSAAPEMESPGRHSRKSTRRPTGNSNSVPRPPKQHSQSSPQRVVYGCERSTDSKADASHRVPKLRREATTLGIMPVAPSSSDTKPNEDSIFSSLKFLSLRKKMGGQNGASSKNHGSLPPAKPVQRHKSDSKSKSSLSSKSTESKLSSLEMEFDSRFKGHSSSHKTSSLKVDHTSAKAKSSQKPRRHKGSSGHSQGSLTSLERCDSLTSMGSRPGLSRENSDASLGSRGRSGRMGSQPGTPSSVSSSPPQSAGSPRISGKLEARQGSTVTSAGPVTINQVHNMFTFTSPPQGSSSISSVAPSPSNVGLPPNGKSTTFSAPGVNGKLGKTTITTTKHISRAANSRVSELASGSPFRFIRGSGDSEGSGNNGEDSQSAGVPPSPYSKMTAPRMPPRYSSGHCSDNSSVLSGELPPAMGRTAIFYHSGGSSGYESMMRDSEGAGSASSARDSLSESGGSSLGRIRTPRSPKKRTNGHQRRRQIPSPLTDAPPSGKRAGGTAQWLDLLPLPGTLQEPFEIKVYEIDDGVDLDRQCPCDTVEGSLYSSARRKMLERTQQLIQDLRLKREMLKLELEDVKGKLMLDPQKWTGDFEVEPDLDEESQAYLESLAQVTADLEYCVNLCKSRVMMETCFDIDVSYRAPSRLRELQV